MVITAVGIMRRRNIGGSNIEVSPYCGARAGTALTVGRPFVSERQLGWIEYFIIFFTFIINFAFYFG